MPITSWNQRKNDLLGMPHGTACNKLRKALLFKYVQMAGHDTCFRCALKIESVDELSIEHTAAWQKSDSPRDVFFDLDGIAFSHLSCNARAGDHNRPVTAKHGTRSRYSAGCRCAECTMTQRDHMRSRRGVGVPG